MGLFAKTLMEYFLCAGQGPKHFGSSKLLNSRQNQVGTIIAGIERIQKFGTYKVFRAMTGTQ